MIGELARGLVARLRDERGQSIVEWLGGTAVLLVLVFAVFAIRPSLGERLRCQVGAQIDRILTIDQEGSCKMDVPKQRAQPRGADPRDQTRARSQQDRLDRQALNASNR
jgi:hypothetical protein